MKRRMSKVVGILMVSVMAASAVGCGGGSSSTESSSSGKKELNIYCWSEYIPESVFKSFEEEYDCTVNYTYFTSTDELLSKVMTGGASDYDVIQPNTYNIAALRELGYIQELNFDNIPNYKYVDDEYKNESIYSGDDGNYGVPYMAGTTVIAYNKNTCPIEIKEFDDLLDPALQSQIVSITSSQSIISMVNAHLGFDPNTVNEDELAKSQEWLLKLKPNIKVFDGDAPRKSLLNGECSVAIIYGGDLALAMAEQPDTYEICNFDTSDFKYGLGETNWCVTKDAGNKDLAEAWINYICDPEVYAKCLDEYPYVSVISEASKYVTTYGDITVYDFTDEQKANMYSRVDLGDSAVLYDDVWSTFMNQ